MTRKKIVLYCCSIIYRYIIKKILFLFDAERVHITVVNSGEKIGNIHFVTNTLQTVTKIDNKILQQNLHKITFSNPIGLSAGFDYEGKLTQIIPAIGFGFGTIGTITYHEYEGNMHPQLGRLPKSKSLMVNKGFRNLGAEKTIKRLQNLDFKIPIGISIGRSNINTVNTQTKSIDDILASFTLFEKSKVQHSYYELNISCPNLKGNITFYPPKNLKELLSEIDALKLTKPFFLKMPIERPNDEVLKMLEVISHTSAEGVIFGNLQKDRGNKEFDREELKKFPVGNFSGKPTFERSNELISLTYSHYKERFLIIGSGGVFSPVDAYTKITLGASLVQLITGMVFNGPQLITEINIGLIRLLQKNHFGHISDAVGVKSMK
jgi:dihydroorotate dehydrogenase